MLLTINTDHYTGVIIPWQGPGIRRDDKVGSGLGKWEAPLFALQPQGYIRGKWRDPKGGLRHEHSPSGS